MRCILQNVREYVRQVSGAIFAALLWLAPAAAQSSASLPQFPACAATTQPELPTRWRAAALLAPFVVDQLYVGEFVYDGPLSLMRATIYGLESGALDLLVTD